MNEITINGIDVSECPLYDEQTGCYHTFNGECVKDSCAVYKWLLEHKRLQEKNKELKEMLSKEPKAMQAFQTAYSGLKKDNEVLWGMVKDYKTALEEIRKKITSVCAYCNNIDGFTTLDDCENVCEKGVIKYLKIIDEVLNDRD